MTNTKHNSLTPKRSRSDKHFATNKLLGTSILAVFLLSGCDLTPAPERFEAATNLPTYERMNPQCIQQVHEQQSALTQTTPSQYLSLANTAQYCIGDIQFSPSHPDTQIAMQFSALALVNFVKAGDIQTASEALVKFRMTFPQQDLLFDDYTSFVDTATVLVNQDEITPHQLTYLNINPTLRAEIKRARRWSLH